MESEGECGGMDRQYHHSWDSHLRWISRSGEEGLMLNGGVSIVSAVLYKPTRRDSLCHLGSNAVIVILLDVQVGIVFRIGS